MSDHIFHHSVRVPYADTDQMGVVYYANYFVYFEMARSELLREAGLPYGQLETEGILLPVIEAHCDYEKPARFDDLLEIRTRCTGITGARLRIDYEIRRGDDEIARGYTRHACMSPQGRILRPSPELIRIFSGGDRSE